jgi:outer membrane protein OmpA-like peptidoglycan-associated protein
MSSAARLFVLVVVFPVLAFAQKTATEDRDWAKQSAVLKDTLEADWIIRVGDVDNLGFGWPEGFDPFCGRMSDSHEFPWEPNDGDVPGMDRILLGSKYDPWNWTCGGDGYSSSFDPKKSKPVPFKLPTSALKGVTVTNAFIQLFIDDFQGPRMGSRFQVTLNGKRFTEAEKLLNAIDQSGPVGKLLTIPVPEEFFGDLTGKPELVLAIDETKGCADGFALDFVRLLVNRKRENTCKGTIHGRVLAAEGDTPIAKARVSLADRTSVETDEDGNFTIADVPTGFEVVTASASGYADGSATADVGQGDDNPEVVIRLEKGKAVVFDKQKLEVGQKLELKTILFDVGKADLKPKSKPELDKVVKLLKDNPSAEIELSGHTSSEGSAEANRSLSYRRVKACKDYIVSKGIDPGRITAVGYGPDRPVAPNDTEKNRQKNRRVELRLVKN